MTQAPDLKSLQLAVLYGGSSGEREVSLASGETVLSVLREGGYDPLAIDTGSAGWWETLAGVDVAFNIQHGAGGEDGVTQGLLEAMGIVGTGSGLLGSALAMDKQRSKQLWAAAGLPTAEFVMVDEHTDARQLLSQWGAAFIKPCSAGSSLGMSRVESAASFEVAAADAASHDSRVIAERYINGPEYTVAILGDTALPPIRIEASSEFYDFEAKYRSDSTRYHIPCGLTPQEESEICELSLRAFEALGCSVWGRVDLMRDSDGSFQLLEANTVPGMTGHSLVPMAARAAGMTLLELLEEIIRLSLPAQDSGDGGRR